MVEAMVVGFRKSSKLNKPRFEQSSIFISMMIISDNKQLLGPIVDLYKRKSLGEKGLQEIKPLLNNHWNLCAQ